MDLAGFLPLIFSMVAIAVSIITFWLSEFRGPNITLLNIPEFKITDESFRRRYSSGYEYTPTWFDLAPVPFLFANYGGKAGTIIALKLDFVPDSTFKSFFETFYHRQVMYEGEVGPPVTVDQGDNQYLNLSPEICTINWKENALAKVLDPKLKVNDMISRALEKSKESFKKFCDFLDHSQELGKVSCTITLTKGRFRTKVKDEMILEDIAVVNEYDEAVSFLRNCLFRWENLRDTRVELRNMLVRDIEDLIRELKGNLSALENQVAEYEVSHKGSAMKLRLDNWKRLNNVKNVEESKIRWFFIRSKEELEEALNKLYSAIERYNNSFDVLMSLGDLRTTKSFDHINAERMKLSEEVKKILDTVSQLHQSFT